MLFSLVFVVFLKTVKTCKKYSEQWSTVKNCNFLKLHFFQCTSTVIIPLHIFAVRHVIETSTDLQFFQPSAVPFSWSAICVTIIGAYSKSMWTESEWKHILPGVKRKVHQWTLTFKSIKYLLTILKAFLLAIRLGGNMVSMKRNRVTKVVADNGSEFSG